MYLQLIDSEQTTVLQQWGGVRVSRSCALAAHAARRPWKFHSNICTIHFKHLEVKRENCCKWGVTALRHTKTDKTTTITPTPSVFTVNYLIMPKSGQRYFALIWNCELNTNTRHLILAKFKPACMYTSLHVCLIMDPRWRTIQNSWL